MDLEYLIEITQPKSDPRIHLSYRFKDPNSRWIKQFDGRFVNFKREYSDLFDSDTFEIIGKQKPYMQYIYRDEELKKRES